MEVNALGKHYDINRIVWNAKLLRDPQIYECFVCDCEDQEELEEIESEIDKLVNLLPSGIGVLDLPQTLCGNRKTRIYGTAVCSATSGHSILNNRSSSRVILKSEKEAQELGFRPCAKCMPKEYAKWMRDK